jgi:hypothetical protein
VFDEIIDRRDIKDKHLPIERLFENKWDLGITAILGSKMLQ